MQPDNRRRRFAEKSRRERGVVLIWFALLLIVLLGFAGFAVDLSNWWFQAEKLQRAADAGAHAGVVYLPFDVAKAAFEVFAAEEGHEHEKFVTGVAVLEERHFIYIQEFKSI